MLRPAPEEAAFTASTAGATLSAGAKTAAMPPSAIRDISRPRTAANRIPSSRLKTPAVCDAASSPMLCPTTTSGRTPMLDQSAVRAHSSA